MSILASVVFATLALGSARFDVDASARAETRAGLVPQTGRDTSADLLFTPALDLRIRGVQSQLYAHYAPRLLLRAPDELDRPLLLHRGEFRHTQQLSRRWQWENNAYLTAGELDYTGAVLLFDLDNDVASAPPETDVVQYLDFGGSTQLRHDFDPRTRGRFRLEGSYTGPPPDDETPTFLRKRRAAATPGIGYSLSPNLDAELDAMGEVLSFEPGPLYLGITPALGLAWRLSTIDTLRARGGAAVVSARREQSLAGGEDETLIVPLFEVDYTRAIESDLLPRVLSRFTTGIRPYYDPLDATFGPRFFALATASTQLTHRLALLLEVRATDPLQAEDQPTVTLFQPDGRDEAVFWVNPGLVYRHSDNFSLETGARLSARAPHLLSGLGEWSNQQLLGYVALLMHTGGVE